MVCCCCTDCVGMWCANTLTWAFNFICCDCIYNAWIGGLPSAIYSILLGVPCNTCCMGYVTEGAASEGVTTTASSTIKSAFSALTNLL
jgi:hypothetical protein